MAISEEAVKAKTGRGWNEWFAILDREGALRMKHSEIAALLHGRLACPPWWNQMVANQYEQARGLRTKHEMPDGYQVGVSKTFPAPISKLYSAFADERTRAGWLKGDKLEITTANKDRSIRAKWGDTRVDVNFYAKGPAKTQVSLGHNKIEDAKEAEKMKSYWKKALSSLAASL